MKKLVYILPILCLAGCGTVRTALEEAHASLVKVVDTAENLTTNAFSHATSNAGEAVD